MTQLRPSRFVIWAGCLAALWLAGCSSTRNHAPVEERPAAGKPAVKPNVATRPAAQPSPAAGNATTSTGSAYLVKPGDTLLRIQGETGISWRDLARWNNLDNPNLIEPGMSLRLAPQPGSETAAITKPVTSSRVETKPLEAKDAASAPAAPSSEASAVASSASAVRGTASAAAATKEPEADIKWGWPASGPIVVSFDNAMSKGIDIAGKAGDAVTASAPGIVMFAGPYRGYGNMVILKHRDNFVSAYAHNRIILVKEDQEVRKGQQIAEMGATDSERVKLHFEIRRLGNPLDPIKLLPGRM
ncbi:MAG: peptidoglycan DD-metalloendopeptidase family protein [Burkholderiales bacterium]|nr:peptidoglycan DD-metalloendopeptidase family protein [Burkholderiales bacterium]